MRVFVSFSGRDRKIKNALVEELRKGLAEGTEIWESDEECVSGYSGECIEAIDNSQVFIVLVSEASMAVGSYVLNEVIEAKHCEAEGKLNIVLFNVDGSDLTPDFRFNLNHVSDAAKIAHIEGDESAGYASVVKRTGTLLTLRREGRPELPNDVAAPEFDAITSLSQGYFVEGSRDDIFEKINCAFEKSNVVFLEQISGFGRKSAARKYAEVFSPLYEKVYYFPFFRGSLRSFLLRGLVISNLNEKAFAGLSENDIILKKCRILEKLNAGTLLIVPEIVFDEGDDKFIYDALSSLKCRIIFIAQSLTKTVSDTFPFVSADRMDNGSLNELFFHYYECDGDDREKLAGPVVSFFDAVGGHTKTVELAATYIQEEMGVYPEDVPNILEDITKSKSDGVSGRILDAMTNMFGLSDFGTCEQNILWCASLLTQTPMDEKNFIDALKGAGCFDNKILKSLVSKRWIDSDRKNRLIMINGFLAKVCLARIEPDEKTIEACSDLIYSNIAFESFMLNNRTRGRWLLIGSEFFGSVKMRKAAVMCSEINAALQQDRDIKELPFEMILEEAEASGHAESVYDLLEQIKTFYYALKAFEGISRGDVEVGKDEDMDLAFFKMVLLDMLKGLNQTPDVSPQLIELRDLIERMTQNVRLAPMELISFAEKRLQNDSSESDENADLVDMCLSKLVLNMIEMSSDHPYALLQLCRLRERIARSTGGFYSVPEAFRVKCYKFDSLLKLGKDDDEIRGSYYDALDYLGEAEKEFGGKGISPVEWFVSLRDSYVKLLVSRDEIDEAEDVLRRLFEIDLDSEDACEELINASREYALSLIGKDEETRAREILVETCGLGSIKLFEKGGLRNGSPELNADIETIKDMITALDNPLCEGNVKGEYQNYYDAYAIQTNPKDAAKFAAIAERATRFDYSGLDADGLIEKKKTLEARAKKGESMTSLAPEAFALVSETGFRILGYKHYYVQYLGAAAMIGGGIAEMQNGEGKTYTLPLVAFLYSLYGKQVHIVDNSEYLCIRNFEWMRGIYEALGCKVGCFLDNDESLDGERERLLSECNIIYSEIKTEVFRLLNEEKGRRSFVTHPLRRDVLIADEIDYLIDEAAHSYVLAEKNSDDGKRKEICRIVRQVFDAVDRSPDKDGYYVIRDRSVTLGEKLYTAFENLSGLNIAQLSSEGKETLDTAFRACVGSRYVLEKGKDYFIRIVSGQPGIRAYLEDTTNGSLKRMNPVNEYFILLEEGVPEDLASEVLKEAKERDQITTYSFVNSFGSICGTTATASSTAELFEEYYGLSVYRIPTNAPVIRTEHPPRLYADKKKKQQIITGIVKEKAQTRQPVLVICESTAESKEFYRILEREGVKATLLNVENAEDRPEALSSAGRLGAVTITTALANRGVDICLGGNSRLLAKKEMVDSGTNVRTLERAIYGSYDGDPDSAEIRRKYNYLSTLWDVRLADERETAKQLGGLCVIGTTCFDDLRTEQQLIGRCGRQGCPGESFVIYSLTDPSFLRICSAVNIVKKMIAFDCLEVTQGSYLWKSLKSAREKKQYISFSGADKTCDALCLMPLREKMHFPIYEANKEGDAGEKLVRIMSRSPIFAESVNAYRKKRPSSASSRFVSLVLSLDPQMVERKGDVLENLAKFTVEYFCRDTGLASNKERSENVINGAIRACAEVSFSNSWAEYVEEAKNKYSVVRSAKHFEHNLKKYVDTHGQKVYDRAADNFMFKLLELPSEKRGMSKKVVIGRNDPCPCGSGLKYRSCCGKTDRSEGAQQN